MIAYLHGCQMSGFKRLTEVCQGLFGLTISQGAIANVLARVGEAIAAPAERIAAEVRASEVIASDETSARVKGKTWWQWTFGCATAVYHLIAPTCGKCVPTDFLGGVKPKMWLSDRLAAQLGHAEEHQFCLAHLIRDAQYAIDHGDTIFAPDFKALLQDACAVGRRRPDLADATIAAHRRRLILDRVITGHVRFAEDVDFAVRRPARRPVASSAERPRRFRPPARQATQQGTGICCTFVRRTRW
jgi:transposase